MMDNQDVTGASPVATGLSAPDGAEPPSRLGATPAIPSAVIAQRCEAAKRSSTGLDSDISKAVGWADSFTASLDRALSLLWAENDWRRLTPVSMSIYAQSPYNAAAQVRYDGYGATPALQLCAAFFKMLAAREKKASGIETRRAAATKIDAVHESPTGEAGDAQQPPPSR